MRYLRWANEITNHNNTCTCYIDYDKSNILQSINSAYNLFKLTMWTKQAFGWVTAFCSDTFMFRNPMIRQHDIPTPLCSDAHMFHNPNVPTSLCSDTPMLRHPYIPPPCSNASMFRHPHVPTTQCFDYPLYLNINLNFLRVHFLVQLSSSVCLLKLNNIIDWNLAHVSWAVRAERWTGFSVNFTK